MKIRRFAPLIAGLAIVAATSSGKATGAGFVCPDGYYPTFNIFVLDPPDKNNNGLVCVKGPQGENQHFNTKDDKQPQQPQVVDDIYVP